MVRENHFDGSHIAWINNETFYFDEIKKTQKTTFSSNDIYSLNITDIANTPIDS